MAMTDVPQRFYRLLYFSPRPEDDERVCVGVLLYDSGRAFLEFDEKLDKAHCFAPDYTKASLAFVLETIRENSGRAALDGKLPEFSPQFQLSTERALRHPVDEKVRTVLRQKYLLKPKSPEPRKREKGLGRCIDRFLADNFGIPVRAIRRQATVEELLGPDARELPKDLTPRTVARALVSDSEICLMDGVDLHVESADLLVNRVSKVAHTFWQYKKALDYLAHSERKRLYRAALIFDGHGPEVEASLKWRQDYAVHQLEKDADITVKTGSPEQEMALQGALKTRHLLSV
jgi:hypothetical protein